MIGNEPGRRSLRSRFNAYVRNRSVGIRLLSLYIFGFVAVVAVLITWNYRESVAAVTGNAEIQLAVEQQRVNDRLLQSMDKAQTLADSTARREDLAASLSSGDDEAILAILEPFFTELSYNVRVSGISVFGPDGRETVRVINNIRFPDVQMEVRELETEQMRAVSGFRILETGLEAFSRSPVLRDFEWIGFVEIGLIIDWFYIQKIQYDSRFDYAVFVNQDRTGTPELYASTSDWPQSTAGDSRLTETGEGHEIRSIVPIIGPDGRTVCHFGVSTSLEDEFRILNRALRRDVSILSGTMLILFLLLWSGIGRLVLQPMRRMRDFASRQMDGDLEARIPIRRQDEIGTISQMFNELADQVRTEMEHRMDTIRELQLTKSSLEQRETELREVNTTLERKVADRTRELSETNEQLQKSLEVLTETRNRIVEREKVAALGELTAQVAHEINTPIGVSYTSATLLLETIDKLEPEMLRGAGDGENLYEVMVTSTDLIRRNLERTAGLIRSFRRMASDGSDTTPRVFRIGEYLESTILPTLSPMIRHSGTEVAVTSGEDLPILGIPGDYGQIFTNLIQNTITHGYDGRGGRASIVLEFPGTDLVIRYRDYGSGISTADAERIFEPFFSTRKQEGSSGVGMTIIHNIVVVKMHGNVALVPPDGRGVRFILRIPDAVARATGEARRNTESDPS